MIVALRGPRSRIQPRDSCVAVFSEAAHPVPPRKEQMTEIGLPDPVEPMIEIVPDVTPLPGLHEIPAPDEVPAEPVPA